MNKTDNSRIWLAVVNGYAASRKAGSSWRRVKEVLDKKGIDFHATMTGKAGNASELTFDACMAGYRRILAVGGDGTAHDVLNGIAAFVDWGLETGRDISFSDFTLGVIPLGSGNDWVKSLGIERNIVKAAEVLSSGVIVSQDVVRASMLDCSCLPERSEISVSYMVNVGGIGIDARVCSRVNALKSNGKSGKILYVTSLLKAISERVPVRAKVICDGKQVFDGAYLSMAFGVGKYSGGGMRQTPEACLDDGLLDVTVIPDLPLRRIAREVHRLFTGTFLKVPELVSCRGRSIEVYPYGDKAYEPVEVDGEVVGKVPVVFEVMQDQINVMTDLHRH